MIRDSQTQASTHTPGNGQWQRVLPVYLTLFGLTVAGMALVSWFGDVIVPLEHCCPHIW